LRDWASIANQPSIFIPRFKLPRTLYYFSGIRNGVGDLVEAGLPNIEGHSGYTITSTGTSYIDGCFSTDTAAINYNPYSSGSGQQRIKLDASRSSSIYGNSTTVQPLTTQMYLEFYLN